MADKCGTCLNLNLKEKEKYTSYDKYWCEELHKYCETKDYACSYYNPDPNRLPQNNSNCYITTIVCNILGYDDDCELLTILRNFREKILRPNPNYLNLLVLYDTIGPLISNAISSIKGSYSFCARLVANYLIPCAEMIKNGEFSGAINTYENMVYFLTSWFKIPMPAIETFDSLSYDSIDLENIGKGRTKTFLKPVLA